MTLFGFWSLFPQSVCTLRGNYAAEKAALALTNSLESTVFPPTSNEIHSQTAGHASAELEFNYTFNLRASTPISPQACYFGMEEAVAGKQRSLCTCAPQQWQINVAVLHARDKQHFSLMNSDTLEPLVLAIHQQWIWFITTFKWDHCIVKTMANRWRELGEKPNNNTFPWCMMSHSLTYGYTWSQQTESKSLPSHKDRKSIVVYK